LSGKTLKVQLFAGGKDERNRKYAENAKTNNVSGEQCRMEFVHLCKQIECVAHIKCKKARGLNDDLKMAESPLRPNPP